MQYCFFYYFAPHLKKVNFIFFIPFFYLTHTVFAQRNDSLKIKAIDDAALTIKKKHFTYFISNRFSDDNKYDVFKSIPQYNKPQVIIIKGTFEASGNQNTKQAKLIVQNASNNEIVGIYNTNKYSGSYIMLLVPNVKYFIKIELKNYGNFKELVEIPLKTDFEVCHQDIKIKADAQKKGHITITNFFNDEDEKVAYIKSISDSTEIISKNEEVLEYSNDGKTLIKKNKSSIDELLKEELAQLKKKPVNALALFMAKKYEQSAVMFGELLKIDPLEPFYNYYYGISLFKLNKNKPKIIQALQIATQAKEVNYDAFLYLAKTYHQSYLFSEALTALDEYSKKAKPQELNTNFVNQLIQNCKSGNELMASPVNIDVLKRTPANEADVLNNFDNETTSQYIRYKTDAFTSPLEKLKKQKFLLSNFNKHYFVHVGYADKTATQTDLFKNLLLPNGKLSLSSKIESEINTAFDENYPFISSDGKTLYFSSKGHNSMGGYDIFKSTRPDTTSEWGIPENLGYPINSPFDDFMFVPDTAAQYASFLSNRKENKLEIINIKLPKGSGQYYVLKGNFSYGDSTNNHDGLITLFNNKTGENAGTYKPNINTGNYLMILSPSAKYEVNVEAKDYAELNGAFDVPDKRGDFVLKQIMKGVKEKNNKKTLKIINYFTQYESDKLNLDNLSALAKKEEKNSQPVATKKVSRTAIEQEKDKTDLETAENLYEKSLYQEAATIYSKLQPILNFTPNQHYQYGISLYHSKRNKPECIKELEIASKYKDVSPDIYYFLAKSYYENYQFSDAINLFKKFITLASPDLSAKYNIEKEISYCQNGIKLINNPTLILEIYEKKRSDLSNFQNAITGLESGGRILVLTDDLKSSIDKKKNHKPLFYLTPDKSTIYVSSYGEDETNSKDIYCIKKLSSGKWSAPMPIATINTSLDEDYPCLSADGKTLYFSSKGYDSMGGYDIYKSTWNNETQTWDKPINLGSPVNSPFDDLYFLE
ncbi:MAG: PD40 domain-containing protein [Bacteroidetes bacterium]|nr:PD40 domain-containing protein [Bacteroidota bacterium]